MLKSAHVLKRTFPCGRAPWLPLALALPLVLCTGGCPRKGPGARPVSDSGQSDRDDRSEAPPDLEQIEIEVGALTFTARVAGPENGDVVILLHGFPQTSYEFRHALHVLGKAGYRAVAPDQRGYAEGARPPNVEDYAAPLLVTDLLGIADQLGAERFHLVGHDWGALVAWITAARVAPRVKSLTAVSTAHPAALALERAKPDSCQAQASAIWAERKAPDAVERLLADDAARLRAEYGTLPDYAITEYLRVLGEPAALRAALNWYVANIDRPDPPPPLGPVPVPTLYVWGDEDPTNCREPEAGHAELVTGPYRFEVFRGVDHWLPERAPRKFARLLLAHLKRYGGNDTE